MWNFAGTRIFAGRPAVRAELHADGEVRRPVAVEVGPLHLRDLGDQLLERFRRLESEAVQHVLAVVEEVDVVVQGKPEDLLVG